MLCELRERKEPGILVGILFGQEMMVAGVGEMIWCLRAHTILPEDRSQNPSTHTSWLAATWNSSFRGSSPSGLCGTHTHVYIYIYMCVQTDRQTHACMHAQRELKIRNRGQKDDMVAVSKTVMKMEKKVFGPMYVLRQFGEGICETWRGEGKVQDNS